MVFSTLRLWPKENCEYFKQVILQQQSEMKNYPLYKKVRSFTKIKVSCEKETVIKIKNKIMIFDMLALEKLLNYFLEQCY